MTVALTRVDNQFQIAVSDQGPGVEEAKLSSIFDPFVRVKSALSGKGYGLGLAITRSRLAHGGQVEARNGDKEGWSLPCVSCAGNNRLSYLPF